MNYNIYKPSNCLSDFVKYYWQLELDSNSQTVQTNRVIPSGELQTIFHYKTPFREVDKRDRHLIQPQSSICGQQTEYKDIVSSDPVGMLAVVFYPYALRAFLPNLVSEFTDRSVALNDLFPAEAKILEERIIEANSIRSRILLIENFLLKRLSVPNSFSIAKEAVKIITKVNGQITVGEIAHKLNLSKRQLERNL